MAGIVFGVLALSAADTEAHEAVTHTYDPKGRLTAPDISGGPNSGIVSATCFDAAGNRTHIAAGGGACTSTPAPRPAPTQTPTPASTPPVAVADSASFLCTIQKTVSVVANDYDPDNNVPLSLVSITSLSPGWAWGSMISSNSASVGANSAGTYRFNYLVSDRVGTAVTGSLTASVTDANGFLQTDPIGYDDQVNLYTYVANDPVNGRDPTGTIQDCGACSDRAIESARQIGADIANSPSKVDDAIVLGGIGALAIAPAVVPAPEIVVTATPGAMAAASRPGFLTRVWNGIKGLFGGGRSAAPEIRAGSAGGETAGRASPNAVKDAAKAENPTAMNRPGIAGGPDS